MILGAEPITFPMAPLPASHTQAYGAAAEKKGLFGLGGPDWVVPALVGGIAVMAIMLLVGGGSSEPTTIEIEE